MRAARGPIALIVLAGLLAACGKKGPPRPPESRAPLPPENVEARQEGTSVSVSFVLPKARGPNPSQLFARVELLRVEYPLDARPGPDPDGFRRRGRLAAESSEPPLDPGSPRQLQDTTLATLPEAGVGLLLRYGVRVLDRRGRPSPIVVARDLAPVPPLPAPEGLSAEATSEGVRLRWRAAEDRTDLHYNVYRSAPETPFPSAPQNHEPQDVTEFLDPDVKQGASYTYSVRTSTPEGKPYRESVPSASIRVLAEDRSAPAAPARLVAVQEGIAIRLLWSPNEESDVAGYRVYRRAPAGDWQRIGPDLVDHPTFLDREVHVSEHLLYRVTALDRALPPNESEPSEAVEVSVAPEPESREEGGS